MLVSTIAKAMVIIKIKMFITMLHMILSVKSPLKQKNTLEMKGKFVGKRDLLDRHKDVEPVKNYVRNLRTKRQNLHKIRYIWEVESNGVLAQFIYNKILKQGESSEESRVWRVVQLTEMALMNIFQGNKVAIPCIKKMI